MTHAVIDPEGYRLNVGIVLINNDQKVLWAKRISPLDAWQFPQGGLLDQETPREAMYRELKEELGLEDNAVVYIAETEEWLQYQLPFQLRKRFNHLRCIGQKQKWFLLQLVNENQINLNSTSHPEFDEWRWVEYWYPVNHVIKFKRKIYQQVLKNFEIFLCKSEMD